MKTYIGLLLFLCMIFLSACGNDDNTPSTPTVPIKTNDIKFESKNPTIPQGKIEEGVQQVPDEPSFSSASIGFEHNYDDKKALAFLGGTFFDIDKDGKKEFIITGGADQEDTVFRYQQGSILDITAQTGINNMLPSYGAYSIDFDENGYDDLFIARQDGIYYYENINGSFSEKKVDIEFPQNSVPLDIDFADTDGDGDLDMYVSTFITQELFRSAVFNDPEHVQKNLLLQNDGNLTFTDITTESGLDVVANTFTASFGDLDNDTDPDVIISPNTDTVKIFENTGGKFEMVYEGSIYGFWMGLALSDVDKDGDIDLFFSNVGKSIPERLLGGDSRENQKVKSQYLFLENTGNMTFSEKKDSTFDDLGFGWGIVPTDFDLDNNDDYLIMQNYIKWAPHKLSKLSGELLVQSDGSFSEKISDYDIRNKKYGISALVGDVNHDGFDDIVYLNLNDTAVVHLRDADPKNNFIRIHIPNKKKYLFSKFQLISQGKVIEEKHFLPKQGLMTKQDSSVIFGLNGNASIPDTLKIIYANKLEQVIKIKQGNIIKLQ